MPTPRKALQCERHEGVFKMTLAHGTDRLESARLVLRRMAPDDLPFFTRIHALPEVTQYLWGQGRPRSPEESAAWLQATLASYEQLALGHLAVLRKEDGSLIGRCGLTDLAVESAAAEHGIRRGWFGRAQAPAGVALTFECELGYTFDPAFWGQGFPTEAVRCVRDYARDVLRLTYAISVIQPQNAARGASPNDSACEPPANWKCSVSRGITTCGRSRQAARLSSSRLPRNRRRRYRRARWRWKPSSTRTDFPNDPAPS